MAKLSIRTHHVDGSVLSFDNEEERLHRLEILVQQGFRGKQLIHELLTDDWAAPPNLLVIEGYSSDGRKIDITIPYE